MFLYFSSILVSVLIHELGHLVAILWNGHKVNSFVVGPNVIERKEEKYVFCISEGSGNRICKVRKQSKKTTLLGELVIISSGILSNLVVGSLPVISFHFLT
ncbi:site-2 protease family protein [Reinekea sp. G2M2-21]|uniref:site-2 protease family protein n=1 Tax=Reinekea sp. G2M2-21 TaxID=2788942 RepID=UPI0018AC7516